MPPRANRLPRKDFNQVFKSGRRQHSPVATFISSPSLLPQLSIVVGKKVARLAHERNRLRRVAYHQLFPTIKNNPQAVIVLIKPLAKTLTLAEYREALQVAGRRNFNS